MAKKFVWGETAFDKMSHEELLLIAKKMYQPLLQMKCTLSTFEQYLSGYDREETLPIAKEVLAEIHSVTSEENMFRQFYRYACDLLYKNHKKEWHICPVAECGQMFGSKETPECFDHKVKCVKITWGIFEPQQQTSSEEG